jgi:uncharacterized small protein (DUF1192 family)
MKPSSSYSPYKRLKLYLGAVKLVSILHRDIPRYEVWKNSGNKGIQICMWAKDLREEIIGGLPSDLGAQLRLKIDALERTGPHQFMVDATHLLSRELEEQIAAVRAEIESLPTLKENEKAVRYGTILLQAVGIIAQLAMIPMHGDDNKALAFITFIGFCAHAFKAYSAGFGPAAKGCWIAIWGGLALMFFPPMKIFEDPEDVCGLFLIPAIVFFSLRWSWIPELSKWEK